MAKAAAREKKVEPAKPHHQIVSLEVTGGFLDGLKVGFADGLNCIIGGRGTGKTTTLEFVRYALDLLPDPKVSPARRRALEAVIKTNLANGRIRLVVETKEGTRYTTDRAWGEAPTVLDDRGQPTQVSLDRDIIFKADIYSLDEIEEIATAPALQLALLDRFIDEKVRGLNAEFRRLSRELEDNGAELLRLTRETTELQEVATDSALVEEKLKSLEVQGGPDAQKINAAHARKGMRDREARALDALKDDLARGLAEVAAAAQGLARRVETRVERDFLEGANGDLFRALDERTRQVTAGVEETVARLREGALAAEKALREAARALADRHAQQELEYRETVAQTEEARGRALERTQLQTRRAELASAKGDLDLKHRQREEREARRRELLTRLTAVREERYRVRKEMADRLTHELKPTIRVSIKQTENHDAFRELLAEGLKGSQMRYATIIDRIVESVAPEELAFLARKNEPEPLAERVGIDRDRARKVIDSLRGTELLYRIETIQIEDQPRIELLDGTELKDSAQLSTGQRCTTILPILLLETERPLLIDQPEDNLDNAYIYDAVVKSVRASKKSRQLIFVTHNPNLPVLGDAERVVVLVSNGKRGSVSRAGTVDELKDPLETLLEGGREAFLLRKQRYGH
jgi:predicted ATP-dependent endonuclease of OLD family